MTKQKFFNIVWKKFVVENAPLSIQKNEETGVRTCAYRGPNGAKCAVGMIIPDEYYDKKLETASPRNLIFNRRAEKMGWDKDFREFLSKAQRNLHDNFAALSGIPDTPETRREQYVWFAEENGLRVPGARIEWLKKFFPTFFR